MARFYITTSIMYTNAPPHIGFALELIQADAIARYRRLMGDEVYFLTGTDEHGTKIQRTAQAANVPVQEFVDGIAAKVGEVADALGLSEHDFIRTSDQVRHWPAAQKLWSQMAKNGDIYKKSYEGYYCVGHEAFLKPSELVDGKCPMHKTEPEHITEENWFFRLTKYRDAVRKLIETDKLRIVPASRKAEMLNLLEDSEDISFSRDAAKLSWGIPVPDDPSQVMYVWADALANYLSGLGYGTDEKHMDFWPAQVHLVGKDITRFHTLYWPAMLLSAGLPTPKAVYVHGFVTVEGEKMSKSLGNIIDPLELVGRYGAEPIRHFLLRELQSGEDGDFSYKNLENRYNSDLANGLGNLVQRIASLVDTKLSGKIVYTANSGSTEPSMKQILDDSAYHEAFTQFRLHDAVANVWSKIATINAFLNDRQPWKQTGNDQRQTLMEAVGMLAHVAWLLQPFMPTTAGHIAGIFGTQLTSQLADGQSISASLGKPLFPRKDQF
jgi:methionyl-tRNA synthetase